MAKLTSNLPAGSAKGEDALMEDSGEHELEAVPDRWHLDRVVA